MVGILNNPSSSMNSHSAGWNLLVCDIIGCRIITQDHDWDSFDELYINHGPNFRPGVYNVIGGIGDEVYQRLIKLFSFKGKIYSVDGFDPYDFIEKRKLNFKPGKIKVLDYSFPKTGRIVIGDSHSISVWPGKTYEISRNDGLTMYGFLKQERDLSKYHDVILYFGNIDVRFHLMRQPHPVKATYELIDRYLEYADKYSATVVKLLPIENESRKLPGTGLYKGKPFYGTRQERQALVDMINQEIEQYHNYIGWPDYFKNELGELSFDIMEPRQSVHIRPKYYTRYDRNRIF